MEGLIDCLDTAKWKEIPLAEKSGEYIEYHVNHIHKQLDKTTICFMVETDSIDPKKVLLKYSKKDPIKNVQAIEIRLAADGETISGMDLDGDVVVLK